MPVTGRRTLFTIAALAMATSSTAGLAAPAAPQQARDPWVTLSMLTPAGAAALAGSATAVAAQPETPPPPPPVIVEDRGFHPPLAVIAVWLADIALMIYIATHDDDDDVEAGESPV